MLVVESGKTVKPDFEWAWSCCSPLHMLRGCAKWNRDRAPQYVNVAGVPTTRTAKTPEKASLVTSMDQRLPTQQEADTINDRMVQQMELRRQARPERRQRVGTRVPAAKERRRICAFCFEPGDHPTPVHCLRALER
jgi:hypothetical protein